MKTILTTAIALLALASPALADGPCQNLPPLSARQAPTVPMDVYTAPAARMVSWCHKDASRMHVILYGCTYQADVTPSHRALILLSDALDATERACVLQYEEAHLPPNNWEDPWVESSAPDDPLTAAPTPVRTPAVQPSTAGMQLVTDQPEAFQ